MVAETITDKRTAILKAALDLISEHGFHGTPMSLVAQEAQVGVGTIYRYFASKEDLINALYLYSKERLMTMIYHGYDESLPIRARFIQMWLNLAHYYLNYPKDLRFMEQFSNSPYLTASTKEMGNQMWAPMVDFVKEAQVQQVVKNLPFEILISMFHGPIVALLMLHLNEDFVLDEATLTLAASTAWDAIKN